MACGMAEAMLSARCSARGMATLLEKLEEEAGATRSSRPATSECKEAPRAVRGPSEEPAGAGTELRVRSLDKVTLE